MQTITRHDTESTAVCSGESFGQLPLEEYEKRKDTIGAYLQTVQQTTEQMLYYVIKCYLH